MWNELQVLVHAPRFSHNLQSWRRDQGANGVWGIDCLLLPGHGTKAVWVAAGSLCSTRSGLNFALFQLLGLSGPAPFRKENHGGLLGGATICGSL